MKKSLVILTPSNLLSVSNTLGVVMEMGEDNFTVPLSSDGGDTVTHYGLLHQASLPSFRETLLQARDGNLPDIDWGQFGVTEGEVKAVIDALIVDIADTPYEHPSEHFLSVLQDQGLVQV